MSDLAQVLMQGARESRRFLILDCCFSSAAFSEFQGSVAEATRIQTLDAFPRRGTSLLCSSSRRSISISSGSAGRTMFSGALLDVLSAGIPDMTDDLLTLHEVGKEVSALIFETFPETAVRPEVHSPDQREGRVADVPLFPNLAMRGSRKSMVERKPAENPSGRTARSAGSSAASKRRSRIALLLGTLHTDAMRLLYVKTADEARQANAYRVPDFIDRAHRHQRDVRDYIAALRDGEDDDLRERALEIEFRLSAIIDSLAVDVSHDSSRARLFVTMSRITDDLDAIISDVFGSAHEATEASVQRVLEQTLVSRPDLRKTGERWRLRLIAQDQILRARESTAEDFPVLSIIHDVEHAFVVPYFILDHLLLNLEAARPPVEKTATKKGQGSSAFGPANPDHATFSRDRAKELKSSESARDHRRAERLYGDAIREFQEVVAARPDLFWVRASLAGTRQELANMFHESERYADAELLYQGALADYRLTPNLPQFAWVTRAAADAAWELGRIYERLGRLDEAATSFNHAINGYRDSEKITPEDTTTRSRLLRAEQHLLAVHRKVGDANAATAMEQQIAIDESTFPSSFGLSGDRP